MTGVFFIMNYNDNQYSIQLLAWCLDKFHEIFIQL